MAVWGWKDQNLFWKLTNLFDGSWGSTEAQYLWKANDTWDSYNNKLNNQPVNHQSAMSATSCKAAVASPSTCAALNVNNSLFGWTLYSSSGSSAYCTPPTDATDYNHRMAVCCDRNETTQARECVKWAGGSGAGVAGPLATWGPAFKN